MKLKVATLGFLIMAALTLMLLSQPRSASCALPACDLEREFYSNNTFSVLVGSYHVTCNGIIQWGSKTNYYDHTEYGDCGNGYGTCGGVDTRCSNGVIIWASAPGYVGNSCTKYVQ